MINFKKIEEEMLEFWEKNRIYETVKERNKNGKKFYFLQGPPYTSGKLHIGHAWNNSMKDLALRFFRMNGYDVWDRAGYDMHGLPTANKVMEELGLKDKEAIIKFGVEKFVRKCQEYSLRNAQIMSEDLKRLGVWLDYSDPYLPVTNEFMGSEWGLFKKAHEQKRLYKGKKVMHWCAACETSLAKHELEYKTIKDNSIFLRFKLKEKEEYLIIWTTTPWTIPFNLAVMVNPDLDYQRLEVDINGKKEKWIVAKQLSGVLVSGLLGLNYKVLSEFKGKELEGLEYIHPFYNYLKKEYDELKKKWKNVHTVILSKEYVDASAGSGLVHCAPGSGPEDAEAGKKYGIGAFNNLNEKGVFENTGPFNEFIAKKDDDKIIDKLRELNSLIKENPIEHEYAHCWRCGNPVIFRTTNQWFLKIDDLVPKILEYNKSIKWEPEISRRSYESWIMNLRDNGVTRQRFWGTPMPIWECECGEVEVIGSLEELKEKAMGKLPENLHKPWIDEVEIKCPSCEKNMKRIPDIVDVWIDSGTVSWNCLYYPYKKELFERYFPADLILEATEQTRLWFSMLQICSTIMFGKKAYTGAYNHGMIFDFNGVKMSKSKGNIVSPYEVIDKFSSDIFRYYVCETKAGRNINFNWEDVKQKQRNLTVLYNSVMYLTQINTNSKTENRGLAEKYILSRLNNTIKKVSMLFNSFKFEETITHLERLFLDISRTYIRITRNKVSTNGRIVYETLKEVLEKTIIMFSCVCPLFCEKLWQILRKTDSSLEKSVHLSYWPKVNEKEIDNKLEEKFNLVLDLIEIGLMKRDKEKIGLKWPLKKVTINCNEEIKEFEEIIKSQLNVKNIEFKKTDKIDLEFDFKITPDLEAEGFSREISRRIQSARKKANLTKNDRIKVAINSEFNDKLKGFLDFISNRVGADEIKLGESNEDYSYCEEGKIKGKKFSVKFSEV